MSYPIGDRRFPAIADLYQDPQGKQPREVSDAPIQFVHDVAAGATDLVMAQCDYNPGGGSYPAALTAVTWTFANGFYASQALLPDDRIWRLLVLGAAATTNAPIVAVEYTGFAGVVGWATLGQYPRYHGNVSAGPYPDAIEEMSGLVLPYGGVIYTSRSGGVDTGRLVAFAVGWPRGLSQPF